MSDREKNISCVALLSGGLDSMLAAALMKKQGIEVLGLSFDIGVGPIPRKGKESRHPAIKTAATVGIHVEVLDIAEEYMDILLYPRHGYGKAANPCIDCHTEMLRRARIYMESKGARFIVTGEVKGQRPMSQNTQMLGVVAKEAGVEDILLRPLSAKLLEPTLPEREGWVDRRELYGIAGRGRSEQIRLAHEMGITEFAQPAGGCLLTEGSFAKKMFDLVDTKGAENINITDLRLLKAGRHFRLSKGLKIILGRDEDENIYLEKTANENYGLAEAVDYPGPIAVIDGDPDEGDFNLMGRILARHGKGRGEPRVLVRYWNIHQEKVLEVEPMETNGPERWRI